MNVRNEYKSQVNQLCGVVNTLSAEDILRRAEWTENVDSKIVDFSEADNKHSYKKMSALGKVALWFLIIVAFSSTTAFAAGAAGFGPLAFIFGNKQEDLISQNLIEQGYYYEANVTIEGETCDLTFHGITGDNTKPMMLFTMDVHDPEIYEANETLYVSLYPGMEEARYDTDRVDLFEDYGGHYCFSEAEAIRDESNHNLYHFQVMAQCNLYDTEATYVIAMRNIMYNNYQSTVWIYDIDYRWSFGDGLENVETENEVDESDSTSLENNWPLAQTGELTFADSRSFMVTDCYDNNGNEVENDHYSHNDADICITTQKGVKLHLRFAEFGQYETEINMYMDLEENSDFAALAVYEAGNEELDNDFEATFEGAKLVSDGNEINLQRNNSLYWFDFNDVVTSNDRGYISAIFDPIGTGKPSSLKLIMADGTEYILR